MSSSNFTALEAKQAQEADTKQREATVAEVEALAKKILSDGETFVAAAAAIVGSSAYSAMVVPEASGVNNRGRVVAGEVAQACDLIVKLLRVHGAAVIRGEAPPVLRKPATAPYKAPAEVVAPSVTVFAMRPIKFKNGAGKLVVVQKFQDAEMPPATAARALAMKARVHLNDPLRRQHHGTVEGHGRADLALDLDADPVQQPAIDPIMSSAFVPMNRDRGSAGTSFLMWLLPDVSGASAVRLVRLLNYSARTGLRVHWAPGIPHAPRFEGEKLQHQLGARSASARVKVSAFGVIARRARRSGRFTHGPDQGPPRSRNRPNPSSRIRARKSGFCDFFSAK
jgi:hypothetical protein